MKYSFGLILILLLVVSCGKNTKRCWRCEFASTDNRFSWTDTTVCDMTESEAKAFQQNHVKELKAGKGFPDGTQVTSACNKAPVR
ncbi:MAG: hypothetical protein KDC07_00325 [Chitinophagaceae bacterium]|nr:hypothetical protein [Chitinophagaceae bacterium]